MTAATMRDAFNDAEVINIWSVPDMSVINAGRRKPVPMPTELLGAVMPLLQLVAEGTAAPVDYPALAYITTCASLIGGKRRVKPYSTSEWTEPCILWCGVVGDPSSRKSPALDMVTERLRYLERDAAEAHIQSLRSWQADSERAKVERAQWQAKVKAAENIIRLWIHTLVHDYSNSQDSRLM